MQAKHELLTISTAYKADLGHWPPSRGALAEYASQHPDFRFSNQRYKVLTFAEDCDGALEIHYELARTGEGGGTVKINVSATVH